MPGAVITSLLIFRLLFGLGRCISAALGGCRHPLNRYNVSTLAPGDTRQIPKVPRGLEPVGLGDSEHVMWAVKGLSMEKWLCWGSMGISGFVLLLFVLDILTGIPFGQLSLVVDIFGAVACGIVLYISWDTLKEWR